MAAPAPGGSALPKPTPLRLCCACGGDGGGQLQECSACHAALFCNDACRGRASKSHDASCAALARGDVVAVHCPGSISAAKTVVLRRDDPRLAPERGATSALLARCGCELRVVRLAPVASGDNQFATYLMADPRSGFAPPEWQSNIGGVLLYRADGMPLTQQHAWLLWDWASRLMDAFGYGDSPSAVVARWCTRQAFTKFVSQEIAQVQGAAF